MTIPRPRIPRRLAPLLAAATVLAVATPWAAAQPLPVDTVLQNVEDAAKALQDASFTVTGKLVDPDGTVIPLEIDVQVIPGKQLASAYIVQPDALADNQIVLDGNVVKNYTFLTNQVTLFDANDPDALGGLLPTGDGEGGGPQISFDLGKIFQGYDASIEGVDKKDGHELYHLLFKNKDPKAGVQTVVATVPSSDWLPRTLEFRQADGRAMADLQANDIVTDQGLDPAKVGYLPEDAEVIDNRASAGGQ